MYNKKLKCWVLFIIMSILLNGCTKYIPVEVPIYIQNTTEIVNTTQIYINQSCNCTNNTYSTTPFNTTTERVLDLIQRLKRCEDRIIRHMNLSDCQDEMIKMNETITRLNDTLNEIKNITKGGN